MGLVTSVIVDALSNTSRAILPPASVYFMAASVIAAVLDRVDSFTWTPVGTTPTVWFDEVPIRDSAGAAIAPPYVCFHDDGTTPSYTFEYDHEEETALRVEVYGTSLAQVDAMVKVLKFNSGAYNAGAGLDFASSLTVTDYDFLSCQRLKEQRFQEANRNGSGSLVFRCRMQYIVKMNRSA